MRDFFGFCQMGGPFLKFLSLFEEEDGTEKVTKFVYLFWQPLSTAYRQIS